MAKKPISREYRIYLAIWRKAYAERNSDLHPPVTINASNFNIAVSIRQGMYRAIRPYRNGVEFDPDLNQAADLFVVLLPQVQKTDRGKPCQLILKPRLTLSELEADLANIGLEEDDLLLMNERMMNEKLEDLIGTDPQPDIGIKRSITPFYTRDH